jgi:transcriptional regulator with XRE-family HTH domain
MAKKFSELRNKMSATARAESEREYRRMLEDMPLQQLRAARNLTQENLAKALHVNQSEISKIENRTDMYVSTLESYIKAMGGSMVIRVTFPDGSTVNLTQFRDLADRSDETKRSTKARRSLVSR